MDRALADTLPATVNPLKYHSADILKLSTFSVTFFSVDRHIFFVQIFQLLKNCDPQLVCLQTHVFATRYYLFGEIFRAVKRPMLV
ncbi:hypothetical protein C7B77_18165 [Chamaesiphon polymorphus CCALA 037]|uniref:Uncharacterized protein n=1 Tax=Chamaesiphon polymorphus CCALA 037 TaxID=2107692 RepID=A0A2T1GAX1_9CYAN|nr:hypothetical protein C7B77_18165 [Chamaesiphon polymorphus CCALA 037]